MHALAGTKLPFENQHKDDFKTNLARWIGQVFYDILPGHGYEVREEQIFIAFHIADAMCKKKVHFAEAGTGTGKTFAYLLTAIAYARLLGRPVIIACASTALQEQLAGPNGDINTLSRLLGLDVDARMAKDPRQYVCDVRVNRLTNMINKQPGSSLNEVLAWAGQTGLGERSEIPHVSDRVWASVAWNEFSFCEECSSRGFCRLVKAREHYQLARDLIVCDHGIFFDDLWTRNERIADGRRPILPACAAVIFDEGHKVILPAAMRAGRQIDQDDISSMLSFLEHLQGARTSLVSAAFAARMAASGFFDCLRQATLQDERTDRLPVRIDDRLLEAAATLRRALGILDLELQNEQELHLQAMSAARLQLYEVRIERAITAIGRLCRNRANDVVVWVERMDGSFWVVPRDLGGMLKKHLYKQNIPVVFSSATLSSGGDFSYIARTLGLEDPSGVSVGSSFEFDRQAMIYLPRRFPPDSQKAGLSLAVRRLVALLRLAGGRALVLTNSPAEVREIRAGLARLQLPFNLLWEDSAERGHLLRSFREDVSSVLVGAGFWEGIDVPGEAATLLVIWKLPFPPNDPLIEARRQEAREQGLDPVTAVDYPEMSLKLKQGCGRLIRKSDDRGAIAVLDPVLGTPWQQLVMEALPTGAKVVHRPEDLTVLKAQTDHAN
ncbi:MAG: ATP-dependent DNA helicase [Desulfotomaculaceae bacterium]|nr:ATP-dependent DNA helicase [Desulfotomaculaceae bacterium]